MFLEKPKIVHVSKVEPEHVPNAEKTNVRVLFSPEETPTYAMRFFEIDVGGHIPAHKHPWEHEIFVLEGKIKVKVDDKYFTLEPKTAIYIPPCATHEYWNIGNVKAKFICTIPNKPTTTC